MKARKKDRQRKRRRFNDERRARKEESSEDKAFGASIQCMVRKGYPHMEWDGSSFTPTRPAPPPRLEVSVSLMHSAYKKFGVTWSGSRKGAYTPRTTSAISDSGCQTCTAGLDFLEKIGCPKSYLIPTTHGIVGITRESLDIIGAALVRFEVNGKVSRQMVHISTKTNGLYLSETSLKQLGILKVDFPQPDISQCASAVDTETKCCIDDGASYCLERGPTPNRPEKIPFEPTEENIPKLEKWLLEAFSSSAFNDCTHQTLQTMTGEPMKIQVKPGAEPYACFTPIPVPFHLKEKVKNNLDSETRMEVIERVPQGEVPPWRARMLAVVKPNGEPRRVVDFQELNKATSREVHHTPSPINLVASIPSGKLKTVLDAWNGYHSLLLDPDSKDLTTFITEWGCYRYCRAPQGFHGSGDAYTRRFDDITKDETQYLRCVDDGLLYDDDIESSFWHVFDHIKLCADNGVVFNKPKFKFARETVEFAGFDVTMEGYRPSNRIISAIRDFPTPKNTSDVRSWFGIVNQVAYAFAQSRLMQPFKSLLQKKQPFFWNDALEEAFQKSKEEIVRLVEQGVYAYDLQKRTCLATDWSKDGLGFSLSQQHCDCTGPANPNCGIGHWKIVFAGSKSTNDAQKRYCPLEGECLAAAYGLERCRMYTLGCPDLILAVDHNPLTRILNDRHLDTITNPRLQRLKEKTLPYTYKIVHVPGGSGAMKVADALSRHPVDTGEPDYEYNDVEEAARAYAVTQSDNVESVTWKRVNETAAVDEECVALVRLIVDGFPEEKGSLPQTLQSYWGMRDELYVVENVPFKGKKMLVPSTLRPQVLEGLHAANQGVTGMLANARDRFFWPGLDAAVRNMRLQCRQCNEQAPSQSVEPQINTPPPDVPFQQVVADLFSLEGHTFLAYADRYSGWLEVDRLSTNSYRNVRKSLLRWFSTFGVPEELATDGGPPFNSYEYESFLQNWDVQWRLSSAYYPQSNGRAEAAVKSAKRILLGNINKVTGELDTDAAARAIMTHRNTPAQDSGISPSVMLFGRPLRDHLPSFNRKLRTEWDVIADSREKALAKRVTKPITDGGKELEPLNIGDAVQVQNQAGNHPNKWMRTGIIVNALPHRQYQVIVDGSRRITLRNRRFLRKILPICRKKVDFSSDGGVPVPPMNVPVDVSDAQVLPSPPSPPVENRVSNLSPLAANPSPPSVPNPSPSVPNPSPAIPNPSPVDTSPPQLPLRRSARGRVPRMVFSAKLSGKTHSDD